MEVYYKKHINSAMCASLYGFDSGLNQYLNNSEQQGFQINEDPVWLLGKQYSTIDQLDELQDDFRSRIWITYRKNFPSIGGNGPTSDQGWGCMCRAGQMVLAQALVLNHLGRDWKWIGCKKYFKDEENKIKIDLDELDSDEKLTNSDESSSCNKLSDLIKKNEQECIDYIKSDQEHEIYIKILKQFQDKKTAQYSIHQIALMGASEDKPVGSWFGPNTIAQTLKKVSSFDHTNNIVIHVALDNVVVIEEINRKCNSDQSSSSFNSSPKWKPLVLFIPLRLGLSEINPIYFQSIKQTFRVPQSLGIIGGKPNHALYFIGYVNEELIYLDPHRTQSTVDLDELAPLDSFCNDLSYHCKTANRMDFNLIDPSISLCFFFKTKDDFNDWCKVFKELYEQNEKQSLFELNETRMKQWICNEAEEGMEFKDYDLALNDNLIQASEAVEHLSYDEEEFELLG